MSPVVLFSSVAGFVLVLLVTSDFLLAFLVSSITLAGFLRSAKSYFPLIQVFVSMYLYLFVFRYLVLSVYQITPQLGRLEISIEDMRYMLILLSVGTLAIALIWNSFRPRISQDFHRDNFEKWLASKNAQLLVQALFTLTMAGFLLMLVKTGSLSALHNILFSHKKISLTQDPFWQLGLTLWSLFSVPFLTLSLLRYLKLQNTGSRPIFPIQAFLVLCILVLIFGGRLGILISGVISISLATFLGLGFRRSWVALALLCLVVFLLIGNARTETSANLFDVKETLISATYPVLDAAALVSGNSSELPDRLRSQERYSAYLKSFIPRFLWPDKPLLTNLTLDTQIAKIFGYEGQRDITGWPSGFATEPYLLGGALAVISYSVILGSLLKLIVIRLTASRRSHLEGTEFVAYYSLLYFLIAVVKDGDTLAAVQSGIRIYIWLYVVLIIVRAWQVFHRKGA